MTMYSLFPKAWGRSRGSNLLYSIVISFLALTMLVVSRGSYLVNPGFLLTSTATKTHSFTANTGKLPSDIQTSDSFDQQSLVQPTPRESAANSTLGFSKLLALSQGPSWRTRGLQSAAELVGLDFTIPTQTPASPEALFAFQNDAKAQSQKAPASGSARAWLAHIDLLRHIIDNNYETAFIVEDDVDFDISLKHQMQLISDNVRNYTSVSDHDQSPYGVGEGWDVLWLGHCGSVITDSIARNSRMYRDESRISTEKYGGWDKRFLRDHLPEGYRAVHQSQQTVCSFGYGVTLEGARKLLYLATTRLGAEAFDISLSDYCLDRMLGREEGLLNCLVVNPQVFNHYTPPKALGYVSEVDSGDGDGESSPEEVWASVMGWTANIDRSARCGALWGKTCVAPAWELPASWTSSS